MGSVVLAVTREALYADMGHFGRPPSAAPGSARAAGADAAVHGPGRARAARPERRRQPVLPPRPRLLQLPMVLLATLATVIASQAVISGAFSVTRQAVALGFLPRLRILHTSSKEIGQVYVPVVNWGIYLAVVALVVGFRSSTNLAAAYGIAVTGTLAIDTILFFVVVRLLWKVALDRDRRRDRVPDRRPRLLRRQRPEDHARRLVPARHRVDRVHHADDLAGRARAAARADADRGEADRAFLARARRPTRPRGCPAPPSSSRRPGRIRRARCCTTSSTTTCCTSTSCCSPRSPRDARPCRRRSSCGSPTSATGSPGSWPIAASRRRRTSPPRWRRRASAASTSIRREASYFLNHVTISAGSKPGLARWRKVLFATLNRNASGAAEFFALPADRVVELGTRIEL